jgi:DNA-binding XRE family transcriptional regulator
VLDPNGYARRLRVMPGLTGPWQVGGRSEVDYQRMVELDVEYAENWSIGRDLRIIVKTFFVVLLRRGAYCAPLQRPCIKMYLQCQVRFQPMMGAELRKRRERAGLTQEQLSFRADLSRPYISQLERDIKSPTVETLFRICDALDVWPRTLSSG